MQHLAVSADGSVLAAALGGRAGIRVWDARTGRGVFEDTGYGGPARMVGFAPDGRIAATSADGLVRVYTPQGRKIVERTPVEGGRPYGLAWSPDGALLAIGYEDRMRVEMLAASDLRTLAVPETEGWRGRGCRLSPGLRMGAVACNSMPRAMPAFRRPLPPPPPPRAGSPSARRRRARPVRGRWNT